MTEWAMVYGYLSSCGGSPDVDECGCDKSGSEVQDQVLKSFEENWNLRGCVNCPKTYVEISEPSFIFEAPPRRCPFVSDHREAFKTLMATKSNKQKPA
jgi:hypothetical protein